MASNAQRPTLIEEEVKMIKEILDEDFKTIKEILTRNSFLYGQAFQFIAILAFCLLGVFGILLIGSIITDHYKWILAFTLLKVLFGILLIGGLIARLRK